MRFKRVCHYIQEGLQREALKSAARHAQPRVAHKLFVLKRYIMEDF